MLLIAGDQRFAASAIGGFNKKATDALVHAGLLIPDGPLDTTICNACDEPHLVPVVFNVIRQQYDGLCPIEGFLGSSPGEVTALSFAVSNVATALAGALSGAFGQGRN